jgi:hypothetical protein
MDIRCIPEVDVQGYSGRDGAGGFGVGCSAPTTTLGFSAPRLHATDRSRSRVETFQVRCQQPPVKQSEPCRGAGYGTCHVEKGREYDG